MSGSSWWRGRRVVVTGATGFVGAELSMCLLESGALVVGLDREWGRADPLREERLSRLHSFSGFSPLDCDLADFHLLRRVAAVFEDAIVFHLAARPGVRGPKPEDTFRDNVVGVRNLHDALCLVRPAQLIFASSSSVYGRRAPLPFVETGPVGDLTSHYARSKLLGELACQLFHRRTGLPVTVARLFNVYGPRGRADMAPSVFAKGIIEGRQLVLAGGGAVERDLTFIGDAVKMLLRLGSVATSGQNFETVNIGTGNRQTMVSLVRMLEELTGKRAVTHHAPFVPDDLPATQADTTRLVALTGVRPTTLVRDGLGHLLNWILSRTPARY